MQLNIVILTTPQAKGRPRLSTRGGFARAYTPQKTREAEEEYRRLITQQLPKGFKPFVGALKVDMVFGMPIPKGTPKKTPLDGKPHVKKPDLSNILKTAEDSANDILWRDDSQICELTAVKVYADRPFIKIVVEDLGDGVTYL